jgi:hypothetical protein
MQTAMQAHIEIMKNELLNMYQNDIRFGMLLKLIRHADELLDQEKAQIIKGFIDGEANVWDRHREPDFEFKDHNHYYHETYERKRETEVS